MRKSWAFLRIEEKLWAGLEAQTFGHVQEKWDTVVILWCQTCRGSCTTWIHLEVSLVSTVQTDSLNRLHIGWVTRYDNSAMFTALQCCYVIRVVTILNCIWGNTLREKKQWKQYNVAAFRTVSLVLHFSGRSVIDLRRILTHLYEKSIPDV